MIDGALFRVQCAAITNGCASALVLPLPPGYVGRPDDNHLPADIRHLLEINDWHMDHGRWVCGNHVRTAPCEHQDTSGRLVPPYAPLVS